MVLGGVPGGKLWMAAFTASGLVLTVVLGFAGVREWSERHFFNLLWIGLGLLIGQVLFWAGAVTLAVGREELELDRRARRGRYLVRSPILDPGNPSFAFDWDDIDSVALELKVTEGSFARAEGPARTAVTELCRARLRVRKPRRAVLLREGADSAHQSVRELAGQVASFIGCPLVNTNDESAPVPPARAPAVPGDETSFPPQPAPPDWEVTIDAAARRLVLTRNRRGGPPVFGCFLLIGTFLGILAAIISGAAWMSGQTFNGAPMTTGLRLALTLPGLIAVVLVPWLWVSLLTGRRQVVVDREAVRSRWLYPGRSFIRRLPGLGRLFAGEATAPAAAVESVTVIKGAEGRVVEVVAGAARVRIASNAPNAAAEREALAWLARMIRTGLRFAAGKPETPPI